MPVKVMIKRQVPSDKTEALTPYLLRMRTIATKQPGYISGETMQRVDNPGETLVISTWQSADNWRQWVLNKERIDLQKEIDELLGQTTVYEMYSY